MITNPDQRQDPWRESIRQMIDVFDHVVVVCGRKQDCFDLDAEFPKLSDITPVYLEWPQPEWSYEELPRHLNAGLEKCRQAKADWVVKLDIDCFVHENDKTQIRQALAQAAAHDKMASTLEKFQFFMPGRCYEKGKLPLALNMKYPICYGQDETRYTDLCQPIMLGEDMVKRNDGVYAIPQGNPIPEKKIARTGAHVWNYDYTFKTEDRARELLYHFDRSHAKWWGQGYTGKKLEEITPEQALADYIAMAGGRMGKMTKTIQLKQHPRHIQERIKNIKPEEFGHSLWGKIEHSQT